MISLYNFARSASIQKRQEIIDLRCLRLTVLQRKLNSTWHRIMTPVSWLYDVMSLSLGYQEKTEGSVRFAKETKTDSISGTGLLKHILN